MLKINIENNEGYQDTVTCNSQGHQKAFKSNWVAKRDVVALWTTLIDDGAFRTSKPLVTAMGKQKAVDDAHKYGCTQNDANLKRGNSKQ